MSADPAGHGFVAKVAVVLPVWPFHKDLAQFLAVSPCAFDASPSAAERAQTEVVLLVSDDWLPDPDCLRHLQQADAWSLETTTATEPGTGSVAESTMEYAKSVAAGLASDARLFYFHREASDGHDLATEAGARAAVIEAAGGTAEWRDIEAIVELWRDPTTDRAYWERVWGNRLVKSASRAFDVDQWHSRAKPDYIIPDGALVALGFDGAMFHDSTGLVATEVATGHQQVVGVWEQPYGPAGKDWQVPEALVDDAVAGAFQRWKVWRMYCDPPYWDGWVAQWAGRYGKEKVVEFRTNRPAIMSRVLQAYSTAIQTGQISHDGNEVFARHMANAYKQELKQRDEKGQPYWYIRKERSDSPNKIDLAMAAVLSWEARTDAITAGAAAPPKEITGEVFWA